MIQRAQYQILRDRLSEPRRFIQMIEGPRQVGKSTMVKQVLQSLSAPWMHFAADNVPTTQYSWISQCWEAARSEMVVRQHTQMVLVIDEIQHIRGWSEVVKREWDDDTFHDVNIKVVLLGSSRVRLERGLSESLKGRFETILMSNWSYTEMRDAFGWTLDEYMFYGGYPGAASLKDDPERWRSYIRASIVDATINNDILMDAIITKPALLRQTFELAASYSGQLLSLTKMMGQMTDAGNTTTLTGYLDLLDKAGMVGGLNKYAADQARRRAAVPKYQVHNNALMAFYSDHDFISARLNPSYWGRVFESAVGAHILNCAYCHGLGVFYWRDGDAEVDFVVVHNGRMIAIEVKSNADADTNGLHLFTERFHPYRALVVGRGGMDAETFLSSDIADLFR